jgi:hypothetical protein
MFKPRSALIPALSLIFVAVSPALAGRAEDPAPRNSSISKEDMKADILFLSSDLLKGRLTGTPEAAIAAEFIKARLERIGLKGAGPGGSFFERFNLMTAAIGPGNDLEIVLDAHRTIRPRCGKDFYPHRFSAGGTARGPVVFAGFGIRPADFGPSVKGAVVLVLDHEPGEFDPQSPFDGLVSSEASVPFRKTLLAQEKGAAGILFVQDVHNHPGLASFETAAKNYWPAAPGQTERFSLLEWMDRIHIPAAQISPALAETLLAGTGRSLAELGRAAEVEGGMKPLEIPGLLAGLTASVDRHAVQGINVVGLVEGSDPWLKDEFVIVCAHHDHNGIRDGLIQPGADDNISGVAAVIDIAEAYVLASADGARSKRSLIFASWDAEERGLLGAWAYAEHPLRPLDKTVAVLNLDMIGRDEEVLPGEDWRFAGLEVQGAEANRNSLNILGLSRFPALKPVLDEANRPFGLVLKEKIDNNVSQLLRRSDHWPFMQKGVPALWFLTGMHPDYHTGNDIPGRLNWDKMERIARMAHRMSWLLANR